MQPRISIITCTFNSQDYLLDTLKSVKKQTFRNFEHIIIDAYSNDRTNEIIENYRKNNPGIRISVCKKKPKGISNAMNEGIKRSNGEIIHILHSDDYYINNEVLKNVDSLFKKTNKMWLVGSHAFEENNKIYVRRNPLLSFMARYFLPCKCFISHPNTFVKKNFYDKYGYFREDYKIAMDYDLWLRAINHEEPFIVRKPFTVFRKHEKNISLFANNKERKGKELRQISNNLLNKSKYRCCIYSYCLRYFFSFINLVTTRRYRGDIIKSCV